MVSHYKHLMVQSLSAEGNSHSLGQESECLRSVKVHRCIHHLCLKVLTTAEELYEFHETSDQLFILHLNNSLPLTVPTVMFLHTRHLHE